MHRVVCGIGTVIKVVELYLIRHGKTYGNTLGRYIGTTDEELCEEGREALETAEGRQRFCGRAPGCGLRKPAEALRADSGDSVSGNSGEACPGSCGNVISERLKIKIIKSFPEMRRIRPGLTAEGLCLFPEEKAGKPFRSGAGRALRRCWRISADRADRHARPSWCTEEQS